MTRSKCTACKDGVQSPFPFSMAFQPIVDLQSNSVFAYEALVRGPHGESAHSILSQVTPVNRYAFDQNCRVRAISLAAQLGLADSGARLSINFMPGAVYSPVACIQLTLRTAFTHNVSPSQLIFEITENEEVTDHNHLRAIALEYRRQGLNIALDDFGAGYSGLNLLADMQADILKLDMALTRDLHLRPAAIAIMRSMVALAATLGCRLIAEGVETEDEFLALKSCGVSLMQGYLFAKPAFEQFPPVTFPLSHLAAASSLSAPGFPATISIPNASANPSSIAS